MLLRSSITKCRCRLINVGTTGLEWALDLDFCRLRYSRLSTCRPGEILPQNVSRDEERWAAVFRQVCTVNNKAKHRNGYDLMDLFLQITPKHPAKRRWKTLGFVIQVIWRVNHLRPGGGFISGILSTKFLHANLAGQSQENFSCSSDKLRLSYRVALNLVAKKKIVFVFGSCLQT